MLFYLFNRIFCLFCIGNSITSSIHFYPLFYIINSHPLIYYNILKSITICFIFFIINFNKIFYTIRDNPVTIRIFPFWYRIISLFYNMFFIKGVIKSLLSIYIIISKKRKYIFFCNSRKFLYSIFF